MLLVVFQGLVGQLRNAHVTDFRLEPIGQQYTRGLQGTVLYLQGPTQIPGSEGQFLCSMS